MICLPFDELRQRIESVLLGLGLTPDRAALSARLIAETDRDGVRTHGIARLPRLAEGIRLGYISATAEPECVASMGALERWAGHRGVGNVAGYAAMSRALELAEEFGVGMVALGDTTHWMRGGAFGWQAAERGFAAMCWSNTLPNLPPWGATTPALGNNPLILAVPHVDERGQQTPIVLDIAMSQFSYGSLSSYRQRGAPLPVPGGYDEHGELTTDAGAIEQTQRALPIGFWKGSGLAFLLDTMGAMLSGGRATWQFGKDPLQEVGQSQIFLAMKADEADARETIQGAIDKVHEATPITEGKPARYPGEGTLAVREESLREGCAIEDAAWEAFLKLENSIAGTPLPSFYVNAQRK
jgi:3-dehydro-L-gulonate 2-dehydrogenase